MLTDDHKIDIRHVTKYASECCLLYYRYSKVSYLASEQLDEQNGNLHFMFCLVDA